MYLFRKKSLWFAQKHKKNLFHNLNCATISTLLSENTSAYHFVICALNKLEFHVDV